MYEFVIGCVCVAVVGAVLFLIYVPSDENTSQVNVSDALDVYDSEEDDVHDSSNGSFDDEETDDKAAVGGSDGVPEERSVGGNDEDDKEENPQDTNAVAEEV